VTAPTGHLAAARAALNKPIGPLALALAQAHATLALAEEARTANLLRALDYNITSRDDVVKRLWPTS